MNYRLQMSRLHDVPSEIVNVDYYLYACSKITGISAMGVRFRRILAMRKRHCQIKRCKAIIAAAALAVSLMSPIKAFAIESITLPVQVMGDDVVSISLPVISESETSVFDFILDPQGLLYSTDAARYGGGRVEEEATLLFYNKEGEYDFSKHSDWLTVTNRSTVPVQVTVTAQVMDFGDVRLAESDDFGESTEPEVYLAIEDDQGNILPLSADEQTAINLEMSAAPKNTYVFRLDEENHTYQYGMSMDPDMVDFDTYSFGLIGACNPNAEWQNISIQPTITVTWYVEPIMPEEQEEVFVEEKNESLGSDDSKNIEDASDDKSGNANGESNANRKDDANGNISTNGGNDANSSLDNENQSNAGSGDKNSNDNVSGGLGDEDQSDDEAEDKNDEGNTRDGLD